MEDVARELEVEERRLVLLELRRRRQHVVGQPGRLGHEDVDDTSDVERADRLAHPLAVGDRVGRVARLDDHRPVALRVVGEDLLGDDVARDQPGDDRRADARACGARSPDRAPCGSAHEAASEDGEYWAPGLAEVAGEQPDQLLQVADQRGVPVHLHAEVLEHRHARRRGDAPGRRPHEVLVDAADRALLGDRHVAAARPRLVEPGRVLGQPRVSTRPSSTSIAAIAASSQASRPGRT